MRNRKDTITYYKILQRLQYCFWVFREHALLVCLADLGLDGFKRLGPKGVRGSVLFRGLPGVQSARA